MLAQVSYGSCSICESPKGTQMGLSTCQALENSRDWHVDSEFMEDNIIVVLHTLPFLPIHNQFWQFPLCNMYQLWELDELHQLLLDLVKDIFHRLHKYLTTGNVKDQCDNRFTSLPPYPGLQRFSNAFDWMKSSSWQCKKICVKGCLLAVVMIHDLLWHVPVPRS
jgi:hypothetical protein